MIKFKHSWSTGVGFAACLAAIVMPAVGWTAVIDANPTNYRDVLLSLNPGDTMVLAPGTYTGGLPISNKTGSSQQPIIVRGPDDQSAIFKANDCCNTVQLENSSFVEVRNLTLDGSGTNGAFGVDSRGPCHDITLENLRIINYGGDQQVVGISTKGPAWNWIIRRNTIIGAGTGLYLGNSDGTAPFVNGVIEYNFVVDTIGYNMQIKHQLPRPTNVGMPTGISRTIIRHNVWSKQSNAATGANARPNVLVGHFPLSGAGASDRYEIYGNFFYQNPTEALFQGEGNIVLHDNVFVNATGDAVNIQPHNDKPRAVTVYDNTVVAAGGGIRILGADPAYTQKIVGNAVFAGTPVSGPNQLSNITGSYVSAVDYLTAPTAPLGSLDLFPKPGKLFGPVIDLTQFGAFEDGTRDFNGTARSGTYRGAYEGEGTNPGWRLALTLKPTVNGAPAPAVALTADPPTVPLQGTSMLTWETVNGSDCTASGGWSGPRASQGSELVGPLQSTTSYVLTCTGNDGSAAATAQVIVAVVPSLSLQVDRSTVPSGESATLTWSTTNATACTASGAWAGSRPIAGSQSTGPVTSTSTYSLTCSGPGGSVTQQAIVTASAAPQPPASNTGNSGGGRVSPVALVGLLALLRQRRRNTARRPSNPEA